MTVDRMDEILGTEVELIPSSGFVSGVMERLREQAAAPPPIPFPWKRAVPGFVVVASVFGWSAVEFARLIGSAVATLKLPPVHVLVAFVRPLAQAGWVVAALAVSFASWMLTRRVAGS